MELIPIPKDAPDQSLSQVLDGVEYILHFVWNMRGGWFMALHDANDAPLFGLRRMTPGTDMLAHKRYDERVPPGKLLVLDTTGNDLRPGYTDLVSGPNESDLQGRVALIYVPENDPDLLVT